MAIRSTSAIAGRALKFLPSLAFAALSLAASAGAHAGMTLQIHIATQHEAGPGGSNTPADSTRDERVVLGPRYIEVQSGKRTSIYDFASRRHYEIDVPNARYVDYSLFSTVGFRVMEVQNRQGLARMMAAAKMENAPTRDPMTAWG